MFYYRMNMAKAPPLTIIITVIGIYLLFERKYKWLLPLMFAFVWTYSLFPLLFIAAGLFAVLLEPTLISENFLFLRQAVRAGLGVGIVPDYVVQDDIRRGDVVTTLDEWRLSIFGTRMYLLYMPDRHQTRAAATFIDFILAQAKKSGRTQ